MSLSISTFLLASDIPTTHTLSSARSLALSKPPRDFELDHSFRDSHMVVSSLLRCHQARIQVLTLIDSGASGYAFIDQNFAHQHSFPLHKLKHPRRLFGFDGRPARTGDITHVAETTLVLGTHTEKIILFVTGLQHYPVVLGHPRLRRHGALADFANNDFLLSSKFCLNNCKSFLVKVKAITSNEEKSMLLSAETKSLQPNFQLPRSDVIKDQSDSVSI